MRLKRLVLGVLIVVTLITTTSTICLADISGPRWPEIMRTAAQR